MQNQVCLWPKNQNLDTTIIFGVREGGLYKVPRNIISAMVHHTISPCELWHRRLEHLHFRALLGLQRMVKGMPSFDSVHDSIYRGCALGKNVKINFLAAILHIKASLT